MNASSRKYDFCKIAFWVGILLKFVLIWDMEMVDAGDDPHEYVLQVLYPANGGLFYPPGTGLAGQIFRIFYTPYRLGIEATYLFALAWIIRALVAWPWQNRLALGLFLLGTFDPAPTELFNHFYSDPIWMIETMLALGCFALSFESDRTISWNRFLPALIFLCLTVVTRSVTIPLVLATNIFALFALALVLSKYRDIMQLRCRLNVLAMTIPTLIVGILLVYGGTCRFDYLRHGYVGLSYVDSSQYKQFYLTLQSVGEPDGDRYFPIGAERRKLIAKAGPDSNWFIEQLEDNSVYKQAGLENYGKFDIPAGWFHWAAFTATMHNGDYMGAFEIFKSIEAEIATADKLGVIRVRPIESMPDARMAIVAAAFPDAVLNGIAKIAHEPPREAFAWQLGMPEYTNPDFTTALRRRTVEESPIRIATWQGLGDVYRGIYTAPIVWFFFTVLAVFVATLVAWWKQVTLFSLGFVARQSIVIMFFVFFFWYAVFDASGMPVTPRYMLFQHVLLLPLIAYYFLQIQRLRRNETVL